MRAHFLCMAALMLAGGSFLACSQGEESPGGVPDQDGSASASSSLSASEKETGMPGGASVTRLRYHVIGMKKTVSGAT